MTPAQRSMCFCEWKDCWLAIVRASGGSTTADERAVRMGVTFKATGKEKSWGDGWAQHEIDRLLAVMWALAHASDVNLQLRQINQPLTRAAASLYAQSLLDALGIEEHGREAYLDGIARRIFKRGLVDVTDQQWATILGALNHTRLHKEGKAHNHPRSGRGNVSRYHHRVGMRSGKKGQNPASQPRATPRAEQPCVTQDDFDPANPFG